MTVAVTRAERAAEAQRLRAAGLSYSKIARQLGICNSEAYKLVNPEWAREHRRRDNAKRAAEKRAWERNPANRKPCERCGSPTSATPKPTAACLCIGCWRHDVETFRQAVIDGYRAGIPAWRIAEQTGHPVTSVRNTACRLRRSGVDLPYGVKVLHGSAA